MKCKECPSLSECPRGLIHYTKNNEYEPQCAYGEYKKLQVDNKILQEQINSLNKTIHNQMQTISTLRNAVLRDFVECITTPENITKIDYLNYVWISDIKRIYHEKTGETI